MRSLLRIAVGWMNAASFRERLLLFLAAAAALIFLWNETVMAPLAARRSALALALEDARRHLDTDDAPDGPAERYAALRSRELALRTAISAADLELRAAGNGMIDPKQMVAVLTEVLGHQSGLTLLLLRNLPAEAVLASGPDRGPLGTPESPAGPYVHPVELVLRGNYLSVLAYLRELESRTWSFEWRRFEFTETADGPEYRIEFTTVSMQPYWLGV